MRLHGLLCFYDEPIPDLIACIAGLHDAGVDHLVAVDGAYALYPDAQAASHPNQHAAIHLACRKLGLACTLHVPSQPWPGNEVQKRTAHFALAWSMAAPGDWFWVQDADMVVTECPADLKDRLAATEHDTAEVELLDVVAQRARQLDWPPRFAMRSLFRAQPITVGPAHCIYTGQDGTLLWAGTGMEGQRIATTLDLTASVLVEHRPDRRPHDRQLAKLRYYADRDAACIERGDCTDCDQPAVRLVASGWRKTHIGPVARWVEVCDPCGEQRDKVSRRQLRQIGVDPESVRVENRNGHAPVGMTG